MTVTEERTEVLDALLRMPHLQERPTYPWNQD